YLACMSESNAAQEERQLVKALAKEMAQIKTVEDFIRLSRENMLNEKWSMLSYEIIPNTENSNIYDLTFDVNFMGLPEHSYYDNQELVTEYTKLMAEFFNNIYPQGSKEEHLKRAQAIVDFEKKFKNAYP